MRWSINPIALAELLIGAPPPADSWAAVAALMQQAFNKLDARAILYGSPGSPSLLQMLHAIVDSGQKPQTLAAAMASPVVKRVVERLGDSTLVQTMLPLLVPLQPPESGTASPDPVSIGRYRPIDALTTNGVSWLDPVQGNVADCYLIASMIALAWARPATWQARLRASAYASPAEVPFHATFFGDDGQSAPTFDVHPSVPVDAADRWVYARSADLRESWPALVEKAYVMDRCGHDQDPSTSDYRSIGDERACEPQVALRRLVGGAPAHRPNDPLVDGQAPSKTVGEHCDGASGVAVNPLVAWTWEESSSFMRAPSWEFAGLLPNHAYAVLGVVRRDAATFVVVRNPHDRNPPCIAALRGDWQEPAALGRPAVPLDKRGVVAIPAELFDGCFGHVGWIDLPPETPDTTAGH